MSKYAKEDLHQSLRFSKSLTSFFPKPEEATPLSPDVSCCTVLSVLVHVKNALLLQPFSSFMVGKGVDSLMFCVTVSEVFI